MLTQNLLIFFTSFRKVFKTIQEILGMLEEDPHNGEQPKDVVIIPLLNRAPSVMKIAQGKKVVPRT